MMCCILIPQMYKKKAIHLHSLTGQVYMKDQSINFTFRTNAGPICACVHLQTTGKKKTIELKSLTGQHSPAS